MAASIGVAGVALGLAFGVEGIFAGVAAVGVLNVVRLLGGWTR